MRTTVNWIAVIVLGFVAGTVAWFGWTVLGHLVADHTRVHELYDLELRRAQAVQQQLAKPD